MRSKKKFLLFLIGFTALAAVMRFLFDQDRTTILSVIGAFSGLIALYVSLERHDMEVERFQLERQDREKEAAKEAREKEERATIQRENKISKTQKEKNLSVQAHVRELSANAKACIEEGLTPQEIMGMIDASSRKDRVPLGRVQRRNDAIWKEIMPLYEARQARLKGENK